MKKIIFIIAALALVACSEESKTQNSDKTQREASVAQCEAIQGTAPSLEAASDFGNMKIEQSPYDFSSMQALRESILLQAQKESLSAEEVSNGIDELASKLITENFEKLSTATNEAEAEEAMMTLFMRAMGAKSLKTILNI